jgi:hypothetical protein
LSIVSYQFSELQIDLYDSNWLVIAGHAALAGHEWEFRDPCLLTYEVSALAEWFEARCEDTSKDGEIDFMEPNLSFRWSQGILQINFELECLPSWARRDNTQEFCLRFSPSPSVVLSLRADLAKFPIRP